VAFRGQEYPFSYLRSPEISIDLGLFQHPARPILYFGVLSMVFGNFILVYYVMTGCIIDGQYRNVKLMILSPLYWVFMSVAAWRALFQLILKPHYWEKTSHGLVPAEEAYEEATRVLVDVGDND
jgi:hypothetical protein